MLQEEVALLFEKYDLTTSGVVDQDGRLIGMITVDDVMEVAREEFERCSSTWWSGGGNRG